MFYSLFLVDTKANILMFSFVVKWSLQNGLSTQTLKKKVSISTFLLRLVIKVDIFPLSNLIWQKYFDIEFCYKKNSLEN